MGLITSLLERTFGKVHFMVMVGKKPAIEILFENNTITLDIKNPVLAVEAGIDQILQRHPGEIKSERLKQFKKMGYRLIIKYKALEFEL